MQLSNLLVLVAALSVSATPVTQDTAESQAIGVTFYEHINFRGFSYQIPSVNRCWRLPETIYQKVSSVRFGSGRFSCALYKNGLCFPPVLYAGLRESVANLHNIGVGDEIGSVYCNQLEADA